MTLLLRLGDPPVPPLPTGPVRLVRRGPETGASLRGPAGSWRTGGAVFAVPGTAAPTSGQPRPARRPDDRDGPPPVQDLQQETLDGRWPSVTWHRDDEPTARAPVVVRGRLDHGGRRLRDQ